LNYHSHFYMVSRTFIVSMGHTTTMASATPAPKPHSRPQTQLNWPHIICACCHTSWMVRFPIYTLCWVYLWTTLNLVSDCTLIKST
uniref:Uncharacterized protein n=1 Tax=Electrophorus electricus TaxID=8005 RepID=A0A4W4FDY2_ELEEL